MSSPEHRTLSPRACDYCATTTSQATLLRCSSCQSAYYCSKDHQISDRKRHKTGCIATKNARLQLVDEEQKLRNHPGDIFTPANLFEEGVGHFWGIVETRPYMRARYNLVDTMMQVFGAPGGRVEVVQFALDQLLDMLRLCRGDNMGVREIVPSLYLRLNKDQDAYDFLKWWATTGDQSDYDWGDTNLPYLDVKDADPLEAPLRRWKGPRFLDLSHAAAVTLIKVRILHDLQAAQNTTRALRGTIPQEMVDLIRGQLVGNIVASRPDILRGDTEKLARHVETVKCQIKELYKAVSNYNPHFWKLMFEDPYAASMQRPGAYTPQSREEACLVIGYSLASWIETAGAFDTMRAVSKMV